MLGGPLVDSERDFTNIIPLLVTVFLSSALVLPFSSALLLLPLPQFHRQFQELESKFKETYSQSLTTKDERIHVLESRVEEITEDNAQLREELKSMKRHNERMKEMAQGTTGANGSPMGSPRMRCVSSCVYIMLVKCIMESSSV